MKKNFDLFYNNLKPSIMEIKDYVDYQKVFNNVYKRDSDLKLLNQVLKSDNPVKELELVLESNPSIKTLIPNLIAIRKNIIQTIDREINIGQNSSIEDVLELIEKSGIIRFFKEKKITNIIDYLIGLEVGMDTNARKNRVGKIMENKCEQILKQKELNFYKQIKLKEMEKHFPEYDFSLLLNEFDDKTADKLIDFVIKHNNIYYLMEVNFYSSSGSKLNETCKSYMYLSDKINKYENIKFIWITDGWGWQQTKNQIKDAYQNIKYLYNLEELEKNNFNLLVEE
ncbi:DpnII family type II restriction endonuclease [Spiroplasma endosymbiont of Cantharis rufa]|uniref:DpnII family type II restriction endonuclease n=1 Tax=Spiroplasma endosymbiont of Cantharis rufa TaxID=3066279 RepID=UPI0030CD3710